MLACQRIHLYKTSLCISQAISLDYGALCMCTQTGSSSRCQLSPAVEIHCCDQLAVRRGIEPKLFTHSRLTERELGGKETT